MKKLWEIGGWELKLIIESEIMKETLFRFQKLFKMEEKCIQGFLKK